MFSHLTNWLAAKVPKLKPAVVYLRLHRKRLIAATVFIAHLLGAYTSVKAVMHTRTSQGAIAWAVVLNSFPYLAVPAYWVFGDDDFEDYIVARREQAGATTDLHKDLVADIRARRLATNPDEPSLSALERLADLPFTDGNHVELLVDGEETFEAILAEIDRAEKYILVQFFIFRDDDIGTRIVERLKARARQGVRIFLIYDEIGSMATGDAYFRSLEDDGIRALPFNTSRGITNRLRINFRNHRKIVIVDGKTAFVGGINVGDEYLGNDPELTPWRDTHCRVQGPVVQCLQIPFVEDWSWASGEVVEGLDWEPERAPGGGSMAAICVPSGPADKVETCSLFFLNAINSAEERVWITSPYFVPDAQVVSALTLAALRGVDVRILIPEKFDALLVYLSSFSYLEEAENAGFKIYRYAPGFLHQKVVLVDDDFASVGTANLDNRSFRLNFEISVAVHDVAFAGEVAAMLEDDFASAKLAEPDELADRPFYFRLSSRVARLLAPIQ
ncbi:cardiolipin synthase [soil metagenome]